MKRFLLTVCFLLALFTFAQPSYAEWRDSGVNGIEYYWDTDSVQNDRGTISFLLKYIPESKYTMIFNSVIDRSGTIIYLVYRRQYDTSGNLVEATPTNDIYLIEETNLKTTCAQVREYVRQNNL